MGQQRTYAVQYDMPALPQKLPFDGSVRVSP